MVKVAPEARSTPERGGRISVAARAEQLAPRILFYLSLLWVGVVFAASVYKYETFGQGYDQVDFEQAIWNTTQGRFMEDSRFNFTGSIFGMDWMPLLIFFVPLYALVPSAHTLFLAQIAAVALGAVPVYWLARDKLGGRLAGLGAGILYLLYPTLLHGALNPFQLRLFAVTLLLFAFYYFENARWQLFGVCCLLAMLARTDVSLVVGMFGVYALLTRRPWAWIMVPLLFGFGYFALATFVITPSFAYPGALSGGTGEVSLDCWPCGTNPMLAYYGHLGSSGPAILAYVLTHPLEVVQLALQTPKLLYLLSLLIPLLFLPLFAPRPLVLCAPILALNLLSLRSSQFDIEHHYSLLLVPGLFVAAIYGAANLTAWLQARRAHVHLSSPSRAVPCVVALAIWALAITIPYKNPVARVWLSHESLTRAQAARDLVAMVPRDAKVASSSFLAPHLLPRRYIYNFPPAPYSPYNLGARQRSDYAELDYVLVDPDASALREEANKINGKTGLEILESLPDWRVQASREGLLLYKRVP